MRRQFVRRLAAALLLAQCMASALCGQTPRVRQLGAGALRSYEGVYRWAPDRFLYLQLWSEFRGSNQLVAIDEAGDVRTLYPRDSDRFFTGPGAAVANVVESRIAFQRDAAGKIISLTWQRDDNAARVARRDSIERREDVEFSNDDVRLAGTLIRPITRRKLPAIILVHGSGAEDRDNMLPLAHFLVRHGIALLSYDKRGVGQSSGDWRTASFDDLAGDVVAAFKYLRTRNDVDATQIGLLGWSQAGWIMPLAANRAKGIAFLISVSGAAIPPAETTIDEARNEMTSSGMKPETIQEIVNLMQLQYRFARTGDGWNDYAAARQALVVRFGRAAARFPGTESDSAWDAIRRLYFYDPAPALRQLRVPTLAIFGALDDNIVAEKNRAAWDSYLRAAQNRDYTLRVLPRADHLQLEAKTGTNAEMASLRRFVPEYFSTIRDWLARHVREFNASPESRAAGG